MTWPVKTWAYGNTPDGDEFNEYIRDPLLWLKNRQETSCQVFKQVINFDTEMLRPSGWGTGPLNLWQLSSPAIIFNVLVYVVTPWDSDSARVSMGDSTEYYTRDGFFDLSGADLTSVGWKLLKASQKGNFLYSGGKKLFKSYDSIVYGQGNNQRWGSTKGKLYAFWICSSPEIQVLV